VFLVRYPYQEDMKLWAQQPLPDSVRFSMSHELFYQLAPFHILLDKDMSVLQVRHSLRVVVCCCG
jgi:hypothetical protein